MAYKIESHCPRSEGLGPRDDGCVICLDTKELINNVITERSVSQ